MPRSPRTPRSLRFNRRFCLLLAPGPAVAQPLSITKTVVTRESGRRAVERDALTLKSTELERVRAQVRALTPQTVQ